MESGERIFAWNAATVKTSQALEWKEYVSKTQWKEIN